MSQFSRSIFLSGALLAIGLIAVFSIYNASIDNQNATQMAKLSSIEPAAGTNPEDDLAFTPMPVDQKNTENGTAGIAQTLGELSEKAAQLKQSFIRTYINPNDAADQMNQMEPTSGQTQTPELNPEQSQKQIQE